jgi:hypothetical protein
MTGKWASINEFLESSPHLPIILFTVSRHDKLIYNYKENYFTLGKLNNKILIPKSSTLSERFSHGCSGRPRNRQMNYKVKDRLTASIREKSSFLK